MKIYDCKITFECKKDSQILKVMTKQPKYQWGHEIIRDMNEILFSTDSEEKIFVSICDAKLGEFRVEILEDFLERLTAATIKKIFDKYISTEFKLKNVKVESLQEITAEAAHVMEIRADQLSYSSHRYSYNFVSCGDNNIELDYQHVRDCHIEEKILDDKKISLKQALAQTEKMMLDNNFREELERIYYKKNSKKFLGHPVHYKLAVKNSQGGKKLAEFLCQTLYANNRLVSRRIAFFNEIGDACYNDMYIEKIFSQSSGGTIIIDLCGTTISEHKNYASAYENVVEFFAKLVTKFQRNTLFIFIETTENPGFSSKLIKTLQEELYLVELKESSGDYETAFKYLKELVAGGNLTGYGDEDLHRALNGKKLFTPSDVNKAYENLHRDHLRNYSYSAYKNVSRLLMKRNSIYGNRAYEVLNDMIGLTEIKSLVRQIVDNAKVQKMRALLNLDNQTPTMHMVFTGNPGTAKTTVAQLLAHLLSKEGILESGDFVECGRADLVGKYVGWTAPAVKRQFKMARGGILFIDEAYSLIDDKDSSFGDEAINTIVQEMENYRHDVIVIFAGYPDKMKKFLERNEGLRSRIAFQLDFPDYDADELTEILKMMARYRDLEISEEVEKKCRKIFMKVCNKPNFGNGRFARNLLEQALLKQSQRLMEEFDGEIIDREKLIELKPEDFDVNVVGQYGANSRSIGFIK